ncbi:GNAT family N-acetyltransferase [Mycetocola miduiensis]|uniref:Acetyltransferase (GNAT) family protein n=1 Tax=Mycetocola miduiensis TaxID=995034 RepID=A0A1I4ZQF8_9MICO|nr:GNAT family N-acetyltransferase [Mycetocola miduiensis]SFN52283.1 Acetyltransferase (GNAT) family protein [Mycetocola miduiensis]
MSADALDELTIHEFAVPANLESDGGDDFVEMVAMRNEVETEILGNDDTNPTPRELLPFYQDPFAPKRLFLARVSGRIIGRGVYEWQPEDGATAAFLEVEVAAPFRRQGVGTSLLRVLEASAAADGLRVLQSWSLHLPTASDDVLVPPTGFGAIERGSAAVRFAQAHGYRLEQVGRMSRIDLPVDPDILAAKRADAAAHATGYEVVQWVGRCPDKWLTDMALVHQRMSTDAPSAALEFAEEDWDEERMRNLDDMNEAGGRVNLTSAALHVASGRLVGFTDIALPEHEGRPASQEDTLVLKEHRGHRLGMLLKVANLELLMRVSPVTPRITTFNAEENRPMLDVNEAVGFVPTAYEAGWKKTV